MRIFVRYGVMSALWLGMTLWGVSGAVFTPSANGMERGTVSESAAASAGVQAVESYAFGEAVPPTAQAQFAALQAAYGHDWQLEAAQDGLYARRGGTRILFQPVGVCPSVASDAREDPPLCATFAAVYPLGAAGKSPAAGYDPGRTRNEALFKILYGDSAAAVDAYNRTVQFLGKSIVFNTQNRAAEALERVGARLKELTARQPAARAFILPTAGTFKWRLISATRRLSMHSFAIAIDLNTKKGLYWQWSAHLTPQQIAAARNSYPQELIDAFEAEGFIWGGKWDAFDLMHFEYRPEIIAYARMQAAAGSDAPVSVPSQSK